MVFGFTGDIKKLKGFILNRPLIQSRACINFMDMWQQQRNGQKATPAKVVVEKILEAIGRKFQPSERKRAFCHFWGFGIIGKIISSTTSWDAKNIPKIILSQINLGLKIVSHLIHECPGNINSAFNQSWDKEWFQLQAGISL